MALQGRAKHSSKSGKAYPQGLYTALKTANHLKTNFFPHEKKIITHLFFFFPSQLFFFPFLWMLGWPTSSSQGYRKKYLQHVTRNARKRGKLFVYLGTTYSPPFSGKSSK